jgi:hypothetical protein
MLTFLLDRTNIKWKFEDFMSEIDSNEVNDALRQSIIKLISTSFADAWLLIKQSNVDDAKRILR